MSAARSASPSCWTLSELLVLRDDNSPAGTPCLAYLIYKKTLPANSQHFLLSVVKRNLLIFNDTQIITALTTKQQRPLHVWCAALPWQHTDGCLHSQMSLELETQGWHAAKIPPVFARLDCAHSRSHTAAGTTGSNSLSSSEFWRRHRPSIVRENPQRMQIAQAVAHGPARPTLREERSSGGRPVGATRDVGVILGTSQGSAFTGV